MYCCNCVELRLFHRQDPENNTVCGGYGTCEVLIAWYGVCHWLNTQGQYDPPPPASTLPFLFVSSNCIDETTIVCWLSVLIIKKKVEMRLMAHLSGDPDLLRVFTDGGDVFRRIAAALRGRGKKAVDVTEEERRQVT